MDITHLHLHTRDRAKSEDFYRRWFGLATKTRGDEITFMRGDRDFLLALMDDAEPAPLPSWFHFGMRMATPDAVRAKHVELVAAGLPMKPLRDLPAVTSFRCADPDGYSIEVYCLADA
ncbi:MAG: VOC family protein [Burkholderiaceae bacterium]